VSTNLDSFNSRQTLDVGDKTYTINSIPAAEKSGLADVSRLPFSMKVLLENLLRFEDGRTVRRADIEAVAAWLDNKGKIDVEIAYRPARVLMQDFTGVPAVVDLAAMRDAMKTLGGDPRKINPLIPVDLVIDHSVVVDEFGTPKAFSKNVELEYERNVERYKFLKWGQVGFQNFSVVPPGTGICHQVNLEFLSQTVWTRKSEVDPTEYAYPDTLVGTDSHTTMVNGLAVLGWGVGGIEAEAAMLGQPISMLIPEVIGFKLTGKLKEGRTATDLVLTVTQMLRKKGVVGKFVEFFGPGLSDMSVADRATIGNMAPEYGATCGFFPIDEKTIAYLKTTSRTPERVALVEAYAKAQGMWRDETTPDPVFTDLLELDLGDVVPSMAGPKRPQDRVELDNIKASFTAAMEGEFRKAGELGKRYKVEGANYDLGHGDVVIAAITSCTNTSNPFEGRVNPDVRANYLASPPLVVAYALAGSLTVDLVTEPLGTGSDGQPVYLKDIWPTAEEIQAFIDRTITSELFKSRYSDVFAGDTHWKAVPVSTGLTYDWDMGSTYIQNPPYFEGITKEPKPIKDIVDARVLGLFQDSITTDHISPAGNIRASSPAGKYLQSHQVRVQDFNQYGTRRGNHEVMMRGTFANIRIKNQMVHDSAGNVVEGGYAIHQPGGEQMSIYDAAMRYRQEGVPLVVLAGKEYGTGSSRDWAAKGTNLLGIRAVIAESFERIHRSNLVGMGVIPLVFEGDDGWASLGIKGDETITIRGIAEDLTPRKKMTMEVKSPDGTVRNVPLVCRIDTLDEIEYFRNGGILHYVLRQLAA
jgi:aconitase A